MQNTRWFDFFLLWVLCLLISPVIAWAFNQLPCQSIWCIYFRFFIYIFKLFKVHLYVNYAIINIIILKTTILMFRRLIHSTLLLFHPFIMSCSPHLQYLPVSSCSRYSLISYATHIIDFINTFFVQSAAVL